MGFFDSVLDLLFPPKCVFCRKILHGAESDWCEKCVETLPYTEFGSRFEGEYFDFCIAPLYYKDEARKSLMRYKFQNAPIISDAFGKLLQYLSRKEPIHRISAPPTSRLSCRLSSAMYRRLCWCRTPWGLSTARRSPHPSAA